MSLCPNILAVYGEFDEDLDRPYETAVRSPQLQPYSALDVAGYVHMLNLGHALLITDNFIPYVIPKKLVETHDLKTGDFIDCQATFSTFHGRDLVVLINDVRRSNYDAIPAVKATRNFTVADHQVGLGCTTLVNLEHGSDNYQRVTDIFQNAPTKAKKMVLSFDGRAENYHPDFDLTITKPAHSSRDKLTLCLTTFFRAKEMVAAGEDVILVIDSLDKMFNIFNNCMQKGGLIDPNFISAAAVTDLENILRSSTCLANNGTFTIIGLHCPRTTPPQQYITERFHQIFDNII